MKTHFYNAKVNGTWQEIELNSDRGNKNLAIKEFQKFDNTIKSKNVFSSINAPDGCPHTFIKSISIIKL